MPIVAAVKEEEIIGAKRSTAVTTQLAYSAPNRIQQFDEMASRRRNLVLSCIANPSSGERLI